MAYMTITPQRDDSLLLQRSPGLLSKCLFVGCIVSGFGAAWFGSDMLLWRLVSVLAAFYIGNIILSTWEECRLDSPAGEITLTKQTLLEKLLPGLWKSQKCVIPVDEVYKVSVKSRNFRWFGTGYQVFLEMQNSSVPLTSEWTIGHTREFIMTAEQIQAYLDLAKMRRAKEDHSHHDTDDYLGDSSSSESFEHLDADEIADMMKSLDPKETADRVEGDNHEELPEMSKSTNPQKLADRIKSLDREELVELIESWDHSEVSDRFESMNPEEIADMITTWDREEVIEFMKDLGHSEFSDKLEKMNPQKFAEMSKSDDHEEIMKSSQSCDDPELPDSCKSMSPEEIARFYDDPGQ